MDASEESGVIDSVEGLGKIHCHRHRTSWWTVLVKPRGNLVSQRQERSDTSLAYVSLDTTGTYQI